jgi:hypothetical protein
MVAEEISKMRMACSRGAEVGVVACRSCESENQTEFVAEIDIHFAGRKGLEKPGVLFFPKLVVCLDCGLAQFTVPETELRLLKEGAT